MTASILIIDDEIKMGKALRHVLQREDYSVEAVDDPFEGVKRLEVKSYDVLLCDLKMPGLNGLDLLEQARQIQPDLNVIMMTAYASAETAVESMKKGAYDYLIKPFAMDELKILIRRCLDTRNLRHENTHLREQLREKLQTENIVSASKTMQSVLQRARKVADSSATVLITGESGTGKEVLARAVHTASPRHDGPFVTINCGAVPETLLESELFGYRRGAFTGAEEDRAGMFEAAHQGTLFLDEIGEISPAMQVKLLRVLQSGEFQRVGDPAIRKVDVRILAATNQNLEERVKEGRFRTDLYYRLNVVPIYVPPLRERWEDVAPLIEHFLARFGRDTEKRFTAEALDLMSAYNWPGNVRELENAVEHATVMSEENLMGVEALPLALRSFSDRESEKGGAWWMEKLTLGEAEKRMLQAAMNRTANNMTRAARQLGITRRALGYRLRKYGLYHKELDRQENLPDEEPAMEELPDEN
ncbi:sigma-54-dependent Fis family transcriptional regulator [bacterium]|nr:sigma-54-dependent Fis family transcriptional regulator [bacterium]